MDSQNYKLFRIPLQWGWFFLFPILAGWLFTCVLANPAVAQNGQEDGLFITVPSPLTGEEINLIKAKVRKAVSQQKRTNRTIGVIVFDFTPDGRDVGSSSFGNCSDLKDYIRSLELNQIDELKQSNPEQKEIITIAFVHGKVTRHTVLPVMACSELMMSPGAAVGDVLKDEEGSIKPVIRAAYKEVADLKSSPDAVWKMLDRDIVLMKVQVPKKGNVFVARQNIPEGWKKYPQEIALDANRTLLTADQADQFGLASDERFTSRTELQTFLGLSPQSLHEDWLANQTPVAWLFEVNGAVNASNLESLKRRIGEAIRKDANLIILELNCESGRDTTGAAAMADYLANLTTNKGNRPVQTIAYIPPNRSLGAGTFLALGCREIVMGSNSTLGDFSAFKNSNPDELAAIRKTLVELAEKRGFNKLLFQATLDPDLTLVKVETQPGRFTLQEQNENNREKGDVLLKNNGKFLKIDANTAREWGISLHSDVESRSELFARYNLDPDRVTVSQTDWLDGVARFLRYPVVKIILLLILFTGLILEIKMPGFGLPGIIAALAFVLFFWAHSFDGNSTITMLAVFLFVLGLVLLGVEVFILPGFGVTGISGLFLITLSLVLVTLQKMPSTTQDWIDIGYFLGTFAISLVGAIFLAIAIGTFLPHIPYANRLILAPPGEQEEGFDGENAVNEANASLLGAIGMAETPLRPAGKARFGDDYLDVVSEGEYVTPGNRIQIIEIEGNRIVVKQV